MALKRGYKSSAKQRNMSLIKTPPMNAKQIMGDVRRMALTFLIALSSGWVFLKLNLPAPFMMGSLFGVWIAGGLMPSIRPHLGVARWFHIPVVLGLGVLIGASFGGGFFEKVTLWWPTVSLMAITTLFVSCASYYYLAVHRGYERTLSFLCCVPGGQAEAIVMAREMIEKDYIVALFHLVRVVVVFVSVPALLALAKGQEGVENSNIMLQSMPSLTELPASDIGAFCLLAIGGYFGGRLLRVPMAHLLGPMIASAVAHYMGWLALPRVNEFVILAQLAIGGGVGARLAQVAFSELRGYLRDALYNCILTLGLFLTVAFSISYLSELSFLPIWMAFVPGGLYEITLLGLVFGFDVAFIAFHHTARVILIFFSLPFMATYLRGHKS